MCPITYDTYDFTLAADTDLEDLLHEYDDLFTYADPLSPVRGAWTLEKPVSKLEISPDPSHDRVAEFLDRFSAYFYWEFDGFQLCFSRFPELATFASACSTPVRGVLFGYDLPDVAQYLVETTPGEFITEPNSLDVNPDSTEEVITNRNQIRTSFERKGLYSPPDDPSSVAE